MALPFTLKTTRIYPSVIFFAFAVMLFVSWRRWTSPIADSGREMDLPLRLLNGELLYRDVHYLYPPLSPYFNSLLYRIFGPHLDVLNASGIVCAILIASLSYRIARRLLSASEASIATIGVIVWCIFKPAGNLISPYTFAALYAMIFSLGALLMVLRYAESVRSPAFSDPRAWLIGAGLLIGLASITKQEFAVAAAVTVASAVVRLRRTQVKKLVSDLAFAAVPAILIALPVYGWLISTIGWRLLVEDCHLFYTHLPSSLVFYNAYRTGLDRPLISFVQMLGAGAVIVAAISAIVLISDRTQKTLGRFAIILLGALLSVFIIILAAGRKWDGSPMRALPLVLLAIIGMEVWRTAFGRDRFMIRSFPPEGGTPTVFIIAIYSLAILARVALRVPSGGTFGGFFLPTSLILIFYLLVRGLPYWIGQWTGDEIASKRAQMTGQWLFILILIATVAVFSVRYRANFTYEINALRGSLFAPHTSGQGIAEALEFIESETNPDETIAVLPEGSDLAFLTGRRVRLRHQILIPGLMRDSDEREAIEQFERDGTRYIFVVNRPMREFGKEAFGRDFHTTLGRWIEGHYRLVKVCGRARDPQAEIGDPTFFIKVFSRADHHPKVGMGAGMDGRK